GALPDDRSHVGIAPPPPLLLPPRGTRPRLRCRNGQPPRTRHRRESRARPRSGGSPPPGISPVRRLTTSKGRAPRSSQPPFPRNVASRHPPFASHAWQVSRLHRDRGSHSRARHRRQYGDLHHGECPAAARLPLPPSGIPRPPLGKPRHRRDRKSTRLNSSHVSISY